MAAEVDQLLKRAEEAFSKRNYDYARDLYLGVLLKDPNSDKAHKGLYATCLKKNQESGGPGRLKQMASLGMIKGQLQTVKNNPVKRVDITLKYLCDDPNNSSVRTALASGLIEQSMWAGAAIEAEIAFSLDPSKNLEAAKILVKAMTQLGKIKEAQAILEKLTQFAAEDRDIMKLQNDLAAKQSSSLFTSGGNTDYHDVLKNKGMAAQLEKNTQLIKNEEQFRSVVALLEEEAAADPTSAKIPQKLGQLWFDFKKDFETAKTWFQKASQLAPQDSTLRDKVEDCQLRLLETQVEAARKAGAANLNELMANHLRTVIATYERRVQDRPTDMALQFELGRAYFKAGKNYLDKAIGAFQNSVKDPKKKMESHRYLGICFQGKGLYDMAETQYQRSVESGVMSQIQELDNWYLRAKNFAESKNTDKAIEFGKRIMEADISYKDISALVDKWKGS